MAEKIRGRIKLLIIVPTLTCGGVERNVSIICNNIDSTRYEVTLVILNNSNPFFSITNKDISIIDLGITRVRHSIFQLLKLSKKIKPAIILSTANHQNLLFAVFKYFFPKHTKIIARESSIVSINNKRAPNPAFYEWISKVFYKKLDMVVCQSVFMQQDLIKNYGVKPAHSCIINNPFSIPVVKTDPAVSNSYLNLLTVARLSNEKGLERLIKAVSLLTIPYKFTIVGEGNMRQSLQQLISDLSLEEKVFLAGSHQQPFAQVTNADFFLMGSYFEGFPNAMLESLAAGIPVIAYKAPGGISDLLVNYENGILVDGQAEQDFANAIMEGMNVKFDKEKIQADAFKRFNVDHIMDQWYTLFESMR